MYRFRVSADYEPAEPYCGKDQSDANGHLSHLVEVYDGFQAAQPSGLTQMVSTTDHRHGLKMDRIPYQIQNGVQLRVCGRAF